MADWNSSSPADNAIVAQFPANERAARAALVTNFGVDHRATNDANVGKHEVVKLLEQSGDPAATAGEGKLYCKDTGSRSEVFWISDTGTAIQITSGANGLLLNASNALSGTLPDARLSANVPLLDASNVFTGAVQTIQNATNPRLDIKDTTNNVNVRMLAGDTAALVGTSSAHPLQVITSNAERFGISAAGDFNFWGGLVTTNNASAAEVGFKGLPTATDETPVLTDSGKVILATGNVTIPANASVAYPAGTVLTVINNTAGTITIAVTSDTLIWAGTGGLTGTRTLASNQGVATLIKTASTTWVISGHVS